MAYSTGSATSQIDLVQQLAAWLVTQGWTLDASLASGSGWRVHLHKGAVYAHFRVLPTGDPFNGHYLIGCEVPTLAFYLSSSFEGEGVSWYSNLTGAPLGSSDGKVCDSGIVVNAAANAAYYFFHDGNNNYTIVVERDSGVMQAMGFGFALTKHGGNWTGGQYFYGQISGGETGDDATQYVISCPFHYGTFEVGDCNSGFVRIDVDSFTDKWIGVGPAADSDRQGRTGKQGFSSVNGNNSNPGTVPHTADLDAQTVSTVNAQAVLLPVRLYAMRDEAGPSLIATVPSVYRTEAVGKGYLATDEISLGADTYKLFGEFAVKKVA